VIKVAISFAPTSISPFFSADSVLVCIASTEAIHIVLSDAFSDSYSFGFFFVLRTSRVISPPQRKQFIGRFSFKLRQDLQYALSPFLFSPHPSVLQSFNSFSAVWHSEQVSLWVDFFTPHPQLAGS
jgi:hypothetical protein